MYFYNWDEACELHDDILESSCCCKHFKYDLIMWFQIFAEAEGNSCLTANYLNRSYYDFHLLHFEIVSTIARKYLIASNTSGTVCKQFALIVESIKIKWQNIISMLRTQEDKFLQQSFVNAMSACFYFLPCERLIIELQLIIGYMNEEPQNLKNDSVWSFIHQVLFFQVGESQKKCDEQAILKKPLCNECIEVLPISVKDIKRKVLLVLCKEWPQFVSNIYHLAAMSSENSSDFLIRFLCLWKELNAVVIKDGHSELFPPFLNIQYVFHLFNSTCPKEPLTFKLYLDVIMQVFSISSQNVQSLDPVLMRSISVEWLNNLPIRVEQSGFCGIIDSGLLLQEDSVKYNCDEIAVNKVIYILLKMMGSLLNKADIFAVFNDVQLYISKQLNLPNDTVAHFWIVDLFINQDDLLIDAMLCVLKLYLKMELHRNVCDEKEKDMRNTLNPHKMFLKFIAEVGKDHHLLLDFLISNETVILEYFMQYLKLVLLDQAGFVEAHEKICSNSENTEKDIKLPLLEICHFDDESIECCASKLVSYSSSSSSETEDNIDNMSLVQSTLSMFKHLREAIEKLTAANEFPYNIRPLLELLRQCETTY